MSLSATAVSPPTRDSTRLDSVGFDSTRRGATATFARAHTLPSSLHAHSFTSAFLLVLFLDDEHERPSHPSLGLREYVVYRRTRDDTRESLIQLVS